MHLLHYKIEFHRKSQWRKDLERLVQIGKTVSAIVWSEPKLRMGDRSGIRTGHEAARRGGSH